jgi:hypothetical protein
MWGTPYLHIKNAPVRLTLSALFKRERFDSAIRNNGRRHIHQRRKLAETCHCKSNNRLTGSRIRNIDLSARGLTTRRNDFLRRHLGLGLIEVSDHHGRAFGSQPQRNGCADLSAPASDESNLSLKSIGEVHHLLPSCDQPILEA